MARPRCLAVYNDMAKLERHLARDVGLDNVELALEANGTDFARVVSVTPDAQLRVHPNVDPAVSTLDSERDLHIQLAGSTVALALQRSISVRERPCERVAAGTVLRLRGELNRDLIGAEDTLDSELVGQVDINDNTLALDVQRDEDDLERPDEAAAVVNQCTPLTELVCDQGKLDSELVLDSQVSLNSEVPCSAQLGAPDPSCGLRIRDYVCEVENDITLHTTLVRAEVALDSEVPRSARLGAQDPAGALRISDDVCEVKDDLAVDVVDASPVYCQRVLADRNGVPAVLHNYLACDDYIEDDTAVLDDDCPLDAARRPAVIKLAVDTQPTQAAARGRSRATENRGVNLAVDIRLARSAHIVLDMELGQAANSAVPASRNVSRHAAAIAQEHQIAYNDSHCLRDIKMILVLAVRLWAALGLPRFVVQSGPVGVPVLLVYALYAAVHEGTGFKFGASILGAVLWGISSYALKRGTAA